MSKIKTIWNVLLGREAQSTESVLSAYSGSHPKYTSDNASGIATVHTCIKILGETLGKLPVSTYVNDPNKGKVPDKDHYLYDLLHYSPNNFTSSSAFFTALEVNRGYDGNAYARIHRNAGGKILRFTILNPSLVVANTEVNGEVYYKVYREPNSDKYETVNSMDILHFRMITRDGINGINNIEALRLNLSTTWEALGTIDQYYQNNAVNPKAIKSIVSGANQKAMLEALEVLKKDYHGSKKAGQIIALPPNTEIQELQMNPIDAAFMEMIRFNRSQTAALFGVPEWMVGDTQSSKYNNIEQTNLGFKANTMSPVTRMYRQELEYKCLTTEERKKGESIEFNLMAMIETDHKTRLEGYRILSNIGAITPNKIAMLEGLETYEGGNDHYIQTNMMSVENYNSKKTQQNTQ